MICRNMIIKYKPIGSCLIISAGYKKHGLTDNLCQAFQNGARLVGYDVETIYLRDKEICHCLGCGNCFLEMDCPLEDDMQSIAQKFIQADTIVLATPIAIGGIASRIKTLIERLVHYREQIQHKTFYFLLCGVGIESCIYRTNLTLLQYYAGSHGDSSALNALICELPSYINISTEDTIQKAEDECYHMGLSMANSEK